MRSRLTSAAPFVPRYLTAGALAGVAVGGAEAIVLDVFDPSLGDRAILWWTPFFYALVFAPVGAVFGFGLHVLFDGRGSPDAPAAAERAVIAATLFAGVVTAWRWRLHHDQAWLADEYGRRVIDAGIGVAALVVGVLAFWALGRTTPRLRWAVAAVFVVVCALVSLVPVERGRTLAPSAALPASGPNVILIALDTLRADYLKLYDRDAPTDTPGIDRYAADAVAFENGVAQGSWTKASFGTLYTSLRPREHTAIDNARALPGALLTLAEVLRANGYTTLGMSNCNPNNSSEMGFAQGYGHFEDLRKQGFQLGFPASARRLSLFRRLVAPALERFLPYHVHAGHYYLRADHVAAKGLDWIDTRTDRDRPFFLMLHFMDPHDPYMDGKLVGHGYLQLFLERHPREPLVEGFIDGYTGDIDFMDRYVGAFLDGLRDRGLYDDTLIVLTSDHGEEFFEHGGFSHGQSVYDELVRVVLVIKLPRNRAAGARNEHLARHLDVAPTILSLAGVPVPDAMRGQPLLDAEGNFLNAGIPHAFSEANLFDLELVSVRTESEKFIRDGSYSGAVTLRELYDLTVDPGETQERIASDDVDEAELSAFESALEAFLSDDTDRPEAEIGTLSPGAAEQLKALGYVE